MNRLIASLSIAAAAVFATGCATAGPDPDYAAYIEGQVAIAAHQATAETNRLLALAAIAERGDDRVKDRAIAELAASGNRVGVTNVAQPQPKPSLGLELARIFVPALVQSYGIHSNTTIAGINAQASVANNAITFGAINDIAQGGFNLGGQGINAAQSLGQAGIAKIPSIVIAAPAPAEPENHTKPAPAPDRPEGL